MAIEKIRSVNEDDISECVDVIRKSFQTVADEFGITEENGARFTAYATTESRINWHLNGEHRPMFVYMVDEKIVGYYSVLISDKWECELNNLCVLPQFRHKDIGSKLLQHAFSYASNNNVLKINIGIVVENLKLKQWYIKHGFVYDRSEKFDFFPFTCGYLHKLL